MERVDLHTFYVGLLLCMNSDRVWPIESACSTALSLNHRSAVGTLSQNMHHATDTTTVLHVPTGTVLSEEVYGADIATAGVKLMICVVLCHCHSCVNSMFLYPCVNSVFPFPRL